MKFDISIQPDKLRNIPDAAKYAEDLGIDALWATETQHDPFLQMGLAAMGTTDLTIGTAIALSFTRSPMTMAYTCWDLAAMTGGKFILGLGTQVKAHNVRRFSVPWDAPPVPRLREVIESMRTIWHSWRTGEKLRYEGEHYAFSLMTPFFTPPPQKYEIPIYIAGVNTGLAKLTGRIADGFHAHPLNSPKYLTEVVLPSIKAGAVEEGRTLDDISISSSVFVVTGESEQQRQFLADFVKQQISFYASTPSYAIVFDTHGWSDIREKLSGMARQNKWGEMKELITDEMLNTFAVVAEPDEVGAALKERYTGILDRVTPYIPFVPGQMDSMWKAGVEAFS